MKYAPYFTRHADLPSMRRTARKRICGHFNSIILFLLKGLQENECPCLFLLKSLEKNFIKCLTCVEYELIFNPSGVCLIIYSQFPFVRVASKEPPFIILRYHWFIGDLESLLKTVSNHPFLVCPQARPFALCYNKPNRLNVMAFQADPQMF